MSTEDQDALIARLMRELTEAKKELALAREALRSQARKWSALAQTLERAASGEASGAHSAASELFAHGHAEQMKSLLNDVERLPARIEEIRATLKAAGIEV